MSKQSKLEFYLKNFPNLNINDQQSNFDLKEFYKISFKTQRNQKTNYILKNYSFLSSENNFITDNILVVDSIDGYYKELTKNALTIADKSAVEFLNNLYQSPINIKNVYFIDEINTGNKLQKIITKARKGNYIHLLALGGGKTLDFAKFISLNSDKNLISIPSSLATHVYASPKIHALPPIKELGFENTIDGESSHLSLLDINLLDKLYQINPRLILSGFGDLMAFINARNDWEISSKIGKERYSKIVDESINYIISKLMNLNIQKPLKMWIEEYVFIQCLLCNITHWVGSAPASGAEHLFAKCVDEELLIPPLHGEVVAIGVLIFCYIRNKEVNKVSFLLEKFNISNSFESLNITKSTVINSLNRCLDEGNRKKRYTLLNDIKIEPYFFEKIINSMLNKKILKE